MVSRAGAKARHTQIERSEHRANMPANDPSSLDTMKETEGALEEWKGSHPWSTQIQLLFTLDCTKLTVN